MWNKIEPGIEKHECIFVPKIRLRARGLSGCYKIVKRLRCKALAKTVYSRKTRDRRRRKRRKTEWKKQIRLNGKRSGVACAYLLCEKEERKKEKKEGESWKFLSYFQQSFRLSLSSSPVFYSRNWKDQRLREVDTIPEEPSSSPLQRMTPRVSGASTASHPSGFVFPAKVQLTEEFQNLQNDTVSLLTCCKFTFYWYRYRNIREKGPNNLEAGIL